MQPRPPPPSLDDARAPGPLGATSVADGRSALLRIVVALVVAAGLSTDRLLTSTEHMPYGTTRTVLLGLTGPAHGVASAAGLDQVGVAVDQIVGREPIPKTTATAPSQAAAPATIGPPRPGVDGDQPIVDEAAMPSTSITTSTPDRTSTSATAAVDHSPRLVEPADKLRLWAGGDSLGEYVGNHLLFPVADPELAEVELSYRISTGLARPDYFDWLAEIRNVMEEAEPPEALVFMVGGNDDQNMLQGSEVLDLGSEAWFAEYRRRVATFMDSSGVGSSHLYWIGLPPMRDQDREAVSLEINRILTGEAGRRRWVTYVDIQPLFSGPDGGFSTHIADGDGQRRAVRAGDGVHITFAGSEWVAERVWTAIEDHWELGPQRLTEPGGRRPAPGAGSVR